MDGRSRAKKKRMAAEVEKESELERTFAGKLTTRRDVVAIIELLQLA